MISQDKKTLWYEVLKYLIFFALFYVLQCAQVRGLHPFAFGMLFALVWCNQKIWILAPLYILSAFLSFFTLDSLIISGFTVLLFMFVFFMHLKFKKPLNPLLIGIYAFLSQVAYLYIGITSSPQAFFDAGVTVLMGLICMFAYLHFMQGLILRGLKRAFTIDEVVSAAVLLIGIGAGLSSVPVIGIYLAIGLLVFCIFLSVWMFGAGVALFFAVLVGLGVALATDSLTWLAVIPMWAVAGAAMKSTKRAFACLAVILIDVFLGLYFIPEYSLWHLMSVMLGSLAFLLIPGRSLGKLTYAIVASSDDTAVRNIINRSRETLYKRMLELSDVFVEMQSVFRDMVRGVLPPDEAKTCLATEIQQKVCAHCPNRTNCLRLDRDQSAHALETLIIYAFERGKVSIIDLPAFISAKCQNVNAVINMTNNLVSEYRGYVQMVNGLDTGRLLIGDQLYGVSQVLNKLAEEVKLNVTFDTVKEKQILEELMYRRIVCGEAVVYEHAKSITKVTLMVRNQDLHSKEIEKVVSSVLKTRMQITCIDSAPKPGFGLITLGTATVYDMIFGSSGAIKHGSACSGDTHTVLRVGEDKYLMALCDGMGSGENAERVSALAISLIENFYKAGFESELILSSVNKLLALSGEETFTAIDVSVVDLRGGVCDLIKIGSPCGFVKNSEKIEIIPAGALPLGILDEVHPISRSVILKEDDMIVLVTDGVTDSFGGPDALAEFIAGVNTSNPQVLSDAILERALSLNKNCPDDDMTVLVGRAYCKL